MEFHLKCPVHCLKSAITRQPLLLSHSKCNFLREHSILRLVWPFWRVFGILGYLGGTQTLTRFRSTPRSFLLTQRFFFIQTLPLSHFLKLYPLSGLLISIFLTKESCETMNHSIWLSQLSAKTETRNALWNNGVCVFVCVCLCVSLFECSCQSTYSLVEYYLRLFSPVSQFNNLKIY